MLVTGAMKSLGIVSCECWDEEGVYEVEDGVDKIVS